LAYKWEALGSDLDSYGCAVLPNLLSREECRAIGALRREKTIFEAASTWRGTALARASIATSNIRSPKPLGALRATLYPRLAGVANEWNGRMGIGERFPVDHASFLKQCHDVGQTRPTPLLLQYVPGDFNCLPQDLYGELVFPIQVTALSLGTRQGVS
jgi:uncharacterized protein